MPVEKEKKLFENALFFFDTSVILDFYYYSENAKSEIINNLFDKLQNRLWITNQTEYEFLKNRETVKAKLTATYENLVRQVDKNKDGGHIDAIDKLITEVFTKVNTDINGQLNTLYQKVSKGEKHPFLDHDLFEKILNQAEIMKRSSHDFREHFNDFKDAFNKAIDAKKLDIRNNQEKDNVLELIINYFNTTQGYSYKETLSIVKEGAFRYSQEIPPGYMDDSSKLGFQKYGDLLVWKQIIRESSLQKKNVILVIKDLKEDWWLNKKKGEDLPRHELIKEMFDEADATFWMYNMDVFLHKSKTYLFSIITKETIAEVKSINSIFQDKSTDIIGLWLTKYFHPYLDDSASLITNNISIDEPLSDFDYILQTKKFGKIGFEYKSKNSLMHTSLLENIISSIINNDQLRESYKLDKVCLLYEVDSKNNDRLISSVFFDQRILQALREIVDDFQVIVFYINDNNVKIIFDSYKYINNIIH